MKPSPWLTPILVICCLAPLRLAAADRDDDQFLPSSPGRSPQPSLPKDPYVPPSASSILSAPPLFPDLVEEASVQETRPTQPVQRSQPNQSSQAKPTFPPGQFGRNPPPAQAGRGGRRLQKLQQKLGLTPKQMAMIKSIIQRAGRQLKELRQDPSLPTSEKRYYAHQIFAVSFHQIRPLLTARQLRKWRQLREEHRAATARA